MNHQAQPCRFGVSLPSAALGAAACAAALALGGWMQGTPAPASAAPAHAAPPQGASATAYDPALAKSLGADERGMRMYVFVLLKTGPKTMPAGPERDAMFKGHMANIQRLAAEGKLMLAGPYGKTDSSATDWRGLFILAVPTIEEARALVATDPVVINQEMVPEFHQWYGSAAVMAIPDMHKKLTPPAAP